VLLCLQAELPSQSAEWSEPLMLRKGDDAFLPYYQPVTDAAAAAGHAFAPDFVHFRVEDFQTPTLQALQGLVAELARRLEEDSAQLYIHCWGGRGRAGTVSLSPPSPPPSPPRNPRSPE
jgi:alanine transaminase